MKETVNMELQEQREFRRNILNSFSDLGRDNHRFCHKCGETILNTWEDLGTHYDTCKLTVQENG